MGKINASLTAIKTEFEPLPPDLYEFEIEGVEEKKLPGTEKVQAYIVVNRVKSVEQNGRVFRDYITVITKKGEVNEMGLQQLKRYFETIFGIDEVSGKKNSAGEREGGWSDDDFDTDLLKGKRWQGQLEIQSHTPEGSTEPKQNNKVKKMSAA